jgi:hypothetical protein
MVWIIQETKKGRKMAFLCGSLIKDSLRLLFFLRALLVGNCARGFACRLAARLALAARGVFARLDAGLLNSLKYASLLNSSERYLSLGLYTIPLTAQALRYRAQWSSLRRSDHVTCTLLVGW